MTFKVWFISDYITQILQISVEMLKSILHLCKKGRGRDKQVIQEHYSVIYQSPICFVGWYLVAQSNSNAYHDLNCIRFYCCHGKIFEKYEFILRIRRRESLIPCPRHVSGTVEIRQE